jgi:hypothetical protein
MEYKLYSCEISRRGKSAKGTVTVQTFGKPILVDGIAKDWDYSDYANANTLELVQHMKDYGNVNVAIVQQIDEWNMSATMKQMNETALLTAHVLQNELADDKDEARSVANAILSTRRNMLKLGLAENLIPSIESMLESRANVVDKERKAKSMLPRLVRKAFDTVVIDEPELIDEPSIDSTGATSEDDTL